MGQAPPGQPAISWIGRGLACSRRAVRRIGSWRSISRGVPACHGRRRARRERGRAARPRRGASPSPARPDPGGAPGAPASCHTTVHFVVDLPAPGPVSATPRFVPGSRPTQLPPRGRRARRRSRHHARAGRKKTHTHVTMRCRRPSAQYRAQGGAHAAATRVACITHRRVSSLHLLREHATPSVDPLRSLTAPHSKVA